MPIKFELTEVEKIFEKYGWKLIDQFYNGNCFPHNAICKCGNLTKKRLNDLKRFNGCRKCGNNYIPTVEELKKEFEQKGCEFLDDFYVNSHYRHTYRCNCGNVSKTNINNWRHGKRCKSCTNILVFDWSLPANVYLLKREAQFKIGINNRKSWRLVNHKRNGWVVLDKIGPVKGEVARGIEKTILDCLDSKGIARGKKIFDEPFDGYSEVWLAKDFYVDSIADLWDRL